MKRSRQLLGLALAACMSISVIGCSSGSAGTSGTSGQTQAQAQETAAEAGNGQQETGQAKAEAGSEEEMVIGIICNMSSTHAATNGWLIAAWDAAVKRINENGGLDGKMIRCQLYDPESDASTVKQRLTDIKNSGAVCAIYTSGDALAPSAAEWASQNKFPVFLISNTSTQITLGNYSDYAFNMGKNAWGFAKILALHCVGTEGMKNFCFVGTDGAATIDAEKFLIYEGQKINPDFEMLASFRINFNDTEFSNIISSVAGMKPDMVLQQGGGPNFVSFCQQASMFDLFSSCGVYNDLVTDSSTNQPLIAGEEFPYGQTHGVFTMPFWDETMMDEELIQFCKDYRETDVAKENGYFPSDNGLAIYNIFNVLKQAVESCASAGTDYRDSQVLTEAISAVKYSDCNGDHYFRTGVDNQFVTNLYYGTSKFDENYPEVVVCENIETFSGDEYLPSADEMKAWAQTQGYDVSRFQ